MANYLKNRKLIILITVLYTLLILVLLLNRFWQYEAFYYDHGMMESTAYQVSKFKLPLHDREFGRVPIYVDHLSPSLQIVLAPFYWIWDSYETPIIVMSILIGISVLVAYEMGLVLKIKKIILYALIFAYMFYTGMQNALIFFIHDVTLQIPFLMLLFLCAVKRKIFLYYLLLAVNLGFKESFTITSFTLGIALIIWDRNFWLKHGVTTIIISVIYGLVSMNLVTPYFQKVAFGQWGHFTYRPDIQVNPINYLIRFVDMPQKRETILVSLASFGFLPILSPTSLLLVLQDFAQRFVLVDAKSTLRTGLNLHYSANLVVVMVFGSLIALRNLQKNKFYKKIIVYHVLLIVFLVSIFHRFIYHGPFGLIYNREFYKITKNMAFMDQFVSKIPTKGKLMIQNNLAVRFTHNDLYLLISEEHLRKVDPDVVVLDFRPGQNINNYWPMKEEEIKALSEVLLTDKNYKSIYRETHRFIFVKSDYGERFNLTQNKLN